MPLAPRLLGTHVGGRAGESGALAEVLLRRGQAEVGDARLALEVEQDVGRLDVAVDQAALWAWCSASATSGDQLRRLPERRPALPEPVRQVAPLDVLGDDVAEAVLGAADVVDRHDVGVVQPGEGAGLGEERRYVHRARPTWCGGAP